MQLSKRLELVAANVKSNGVVADIGCDHGFTSIFLVEQGLAQAAIAMDINQGPLERARQHIKEHKLETKIQTRLSDGVEKLEPGEADTLLISGMGGSLVCKILSQKPEIIDSISELVLSPQSDIPLVRHFLHRHGFKIDHEDMVVDQGKFYVIIHGVKGEESYLSPFGYLYGQNLINRKDQVLLCFLQKEVVRVKGIIKQLDQQEQTGKIMEKQREVREELLGLESIIKKYN